MHCWCYWPYWQNHESAHKWDKRVFNHQRQQPPARTFYQNRPGLHIDQSRAVHPMTKPPHLPNCPNYNQADQRQGFANELYMELFCKIYEQLNIRAYFETYRQATTPIPHHWPSQSAYEFYVRSSAVRDFNNYPRFTSTPRPSNPTTCNENDKPSGHYREFESSIRDAPPLSPITFSLKEHDAKKLPPSEKVDKWLDTNVEFFSPLDSTIDASDFATAERQTALEELNKTMVVSSSTDVILQKKEAVQKSELSTVGLESGEATVNSSSSRDGNNSGSLGTTVLGSSTTDFDVTNQEGDSQNFMNIAFVEKPSSSLMLPKEQSCDIAICDENFVSSPNRDISGNNERSEQNSVS